ncbi:hypothetical protein E4T56_gene20286 [Termitomyces sp. T112]|nr:hypothetical protein E4T56_gene20286 [Termitomyces sp. T112]
MARAHAASCWVPPLRAGRLDTSHKSPPRTPPFPDHPTKALPSLQTAPCSPPLAAWDKTWSASGPPENPPPPPRMTLQKPRKSSQKDKSTPLTTPVPDTSVVPMLKLLPPTVIHHHLVQIGGRDYWIAGGRHDEIWEIPGHCAQVFINPNDLTNSAVTIMNPDTPSPANLKPGNKAVLSLLGQVDAALKAV